MKEDVLSFYKSFIKEIKSQKINGVLNDKSKCVVQDISYQEYLKYLEFVEETAKKHGINQYSLLGYFILCCFRNLMKKYKQNKLPYSLLIDTASDVLVKHDECKKMYGVYGTFVANWFYNFFILKTFRFGRLEYELTTSNLEYQRNNVVVKIGDPILTIHIPSGSPLDPELVKDSFKKAYEFYHYKGVVAFKTSSWLILKENKDIFPKDSNLMKFYNLWDIVKNNYMEGFHNCWRVFNVEYPNDPAKLKGETTLQKNLINYLSKGGKTGDGEGFLLFDGKDFV